MCKVLKVTRSGYYAWCGRRPSARRQRREVLVEQIRQVHAESDGTYGSPRIAVELQERQVAVCRNTVARYMKQERLRASSPKRFMPRTTDSCHEHPVSPNRLGRDFAASRPNRKWVCDLTYLWTEQGWLYLSVVMDLFSRKIVGWSMSDDLKAQGVAQALQMAIARRKPNAGLLHHSDRGVQYACGLYQDLLIEHGIECSMSRPGNCYDNAVAESFFGTLKTELVHREQYRTPAEARSSVFKWIECWYNRRRRHSSLGYLSPEAFEAQIN
jgi:transposase InsO family protein